MALTEARKELRRKHITATDATAILGLNPWRSAYDVFLSKTGALEEADETEVQHRGSRLESALLDEAQELYGPLIRNQFRVAADGILSATCDAIVVSTGNPVEVKTAGWSSSSEWGAEGTDEIPERVIVQCHVQLLVTERTTCHVIALLPGLEIKPYVVTLNEALGEVIKERAVAFWRDHVEAGIAPADCVASLEVLRLVRRTPETTVAFGEAESALVKHWQEFVAAESLARKLKELAQAKVIAALGNAEAGSFRDGVVTYLNQTRRAFTVPEATFRVLRVKKS